MNTQRIVRFVGVAGVLLLPVAAWAQASSGAIGGVVRDASGAVLPGVTVEASSPALIERVRTAVTDSQGLYQIVDLRRFSRIFQLGGNSRVTANFDIYNLFNSSTILNQNTRYGPTWQAPIQIMGGRLLKVGFQMNF